MRQLEQDEKELIEALRKLRLKKAEEERKLGEQILKEQDEQDEKNS